MNKKMLLIIAWSTLTGLLFSLQFIVPKLVDVWIILSVLAALYATSLWESYYLVVVAATSIWIGAFLFLGQLTFADRGGIFLVSYYILFMVFRYFHIDLDDSLPVKLIRPVFLYKNWMDIYRLILKRYHAKEITYQLRNGIRFSSRAEAKDFIILDETWGTNLYMRYGIAIKPGDIVVDIGAYIGDFTVFASQKAGSGKVIAYEPFKETFGYLERNIETNQCKNVTIINSAVGEQNGTSTLFIPKNAEFGSSVLDITEYGACDEIKIRMCTFDNVFKQNKIDHIDMLKMDCEGGEYEILLSSEKYLKRIYAISLEYHQMKGHSIEELTSLLERNDFTIHVTPKNKYTGYIYAKRKK